MHPTLPARRSRPTVLTAAAGAVLLALMLLVAGWMLIDARRAVHAQAKQAVENIALGLEQNLRRTLESFDLSLRAVVAGAGLPELPEMSIRAQRAVLFDGAIAAEDFDGVTVTDAAGRVVHDSASLTPRPIDVGDRAYFQAHRDRPDAGLIVSEPLRSRGDGQWSISLVRRVNHPDGSFAGVAVGAFRLGHVRELFDGLALGKQGNVSLFGTTGHLVVRRPYDEGMIGRALPDALVFRHLAEAASGTFEAVGAVDGVHRLYAYRQIGSLPLVVSVGISTAGIYADWTARAVAISAALLLLAAAVGSLAWRLLRELRFRRLAEQAACRAGQELAVSLARLDAQFRHSADALFVARAEEGGEFVYDAVNPATEELTGMPAAAMLGQTPRACLPPAAAQSVLANWRRCVDARAPVRYGHSLDLPDGRRDWETWLVPVLGDDGRVCRLVGAARDVTGRNRTEAELKRLNGDLGKRVQEEVAAREAAQVRAAHAERMQALGQLAGGIAHDFNNVLQAVLGSASLIERRPGDTPGVRRFARMAIAAAERGASITRRLLAFSRRDELRAELVDATALLGGLREILAHTLGAGIGVRADFTAGLPPLLADKGQLETVLLNLATNARDAMSAGGTLTLAASAVDVGTGDAGHPAELAPGRYVRLTVVDTGSGMDAATLARAMEPFFTTKPIGQGTGLGLSMAKGFAEQSGGRLDIESAPGCGTAVTLWLPRAEAVEAPTPAALSNVDGGTGTERPRVLLVDDDVMVREAMTEQLADEHDVLGAAGGTEALALLAAGEAVDALVTDLSMPGMDGLALIREARTRRPGLPAVLLTGHADDAAALALDGAVSGAFTLLRKPVTLRQLSDRIAVLLAAKQGASRARESTGRSAMPSSATPCP